MLVLVTGSPGAGKTSNMLWEFLKNPDYADRPKFCSDIPDFDRAAHGVGDFTDIEKWQDCPDGSIIFCDEAQRFLRPRSGRVVPDWLGAFETHRHRGFDFVFITQHPSLIDAHVRRLVGRHHHFHKPFGIKNSIRYTWEHTQENPCSHTFKDAQRKVIRTNPEVFKLYKSTALDTHKRQLPWGKLSIGALGVLMIIGGFSYSFTHLGGTKKPVPDTSENQQSSTVQTTKPDGSLVSFTSPVQESAPRTFKQEDLIPRADNLPWTAPYYDELTRPSDFPRIAACIESYKGCNCYTQQATPITVSFDVCKAIVKNGTFDNWASQRKMNDFQVSSNTQFTPKAGGIDAPTQEARNPSSRGVL